LPTLEAAIGRVDLLEQVRFDGNIDLTPVLSNGVGEAWEGSPARHMGERNARPGEDHPLDDAWTEPALEATAKGESFHVKSRITNEHRSVGARLSGELALRRVKGELENADVTFELEGTAGQSFGAFSAAGIRLILTGQANDFVGKGLSGAELVLRAVGKAAEDSHDHVLLGNVALYGATAGRLFAAGRAGERFAVRNSGVTAVIEGIGDHGCEYMTGGMVVILGEVGINFGAGMTGGLAWIYDRAQTMVIEGRFHDDFLSPQAYAETTAEQQAALYALVKEQESLAHSRLAASLLGNWAEESAKFVLFTPKPQG
jgi:glutamate synthase (NADPH/NADH) large chain